MNLFATKSISLLCLTVAVALLPVAAAGDLRPHTLDAFKTYARITEQRVLRQAQAEGGFLYLDHLPAGERDRVLADLRGGALFMEALETKDAQGRELEVRDGLIHHWIGVVFVPGVGVEDVLNLVQDYGRHSEIYAPEVEEARILERNGDDFRVFIRFRKKKVITVVMDTIHDVQYVRVGPDRTYSLSRTSSVREVENADEPGQRALPDGEGSGFLWRMNSYWRFIERDGGTYIESESISLTRTIPFMLRWLVGPFVNDMPREELADLLQTTRGVLVDGPAARD